MTARLDRVQGPECPACGCEDSDVIRSGTRWGQVVETRRCNHCFRTWNAVIKTQAKKSDEELAAAAERRQRFQDWRRR